MAATPAISTPITVPIREAKFYTHVSDRYTPFCTTVIAATAVEAVHVLDGILYHQSDVTVRSHHTDGGAISITSLRSSPCLALSSRRAGSSFLDAA